MSQQSSNYPKGITKAEKIEYNSAIERQDYTRVNQIIDAVNERQEAKRGKAAQKQKNRRANLTPQQRRAESVGWAEVRQIQRPQPAEAQAAPARENIFLAPQMAAEAPQVQRYLPSAGMFGGYTRAGGYGGVRVAGITQGFAPHSAEKMREIREYKEYRQKIGELTSQARERKLEQKLGGDPRDMIAANDDSITAYLAYKIKQAKNAQNAQQKALERKARGISKQDLNPYFLRYDEKTNTIVERPFRKPRQPPKNVMTVDGMTYQEFATQGLRAGKTLKQVAYEWKQLLERSNNIQFSRALVYKMKRETGIIPRDKPLSDRQREAIARKKAETIDDKLRKIEEHRLEVLARGLARPSATLRQRAPVTAYYGGEYLRRPTIIEPDQPGYKPTYRSLYELPRTATFFKGENEPVEAYRARVPPAQYGYGESLTAAQLQQYEALEGEAFLRAKEAGQLP